MKEFWVYTGLRVGLFLVTLAVVLGLWVVLADAADLKWAVVVAFVISGIGSYFVLRPQREAFAARVETRAERASRRFEEQRAREDVD